MTDYEIYRNIGHEYGERGDKAFDKVCWWDELSRIPLIGHLAAKQADKWAAEASMCFSISVKAYTNAFLAFWN